MFLSLFLKLFYIKPFIPDCSHIPCGPHQHCVKNIAGNATCVCHVFFAPENSDPSIPLDCRFSWVTLLLAVIFSLLSLICIIWIIGAICKACSRKRQYKNVKPVDQPEEEGESIRSVRSFTSIPYNAAPRNCD
ncbi:hypothetical protein MS3_00008466 [Schistosoma haematobium]|uniref:EGF-like domain-containing protein n=1 Tax=Schistosoma haematobium TaxID=6185 RepID=A0A095C777_SCHHA|nr:hypothetical protein MS3_00008466 [Schistosoma haematobium]KAH9581281.1 hypothetical protein MS3_00008466 [Schistosoma haematobium]